MITTREKKILAKGLSKGYIEFADFREAYKTTNSINETIHRFISLDFMQQDSANKFKIDKDLIIQALSE